MNREITLQETLDVATLCQRLSEQTDQKISAHSTIQEKVVHVFVQKTTVSVLLNALASLYGWRVIRRSSGELFLENLPLPRVTSVSTETLLAPLSREIQTFIKKTVATHAPSRPLLYSDPRLVPSVRSATIIDQLRIEQQRQIVSAVRTPLAKSPQAQVSALPEDIRHRITFFVFADALRETISLTERPLLEALQVLDSGAIERKGKTMTLSVPNPKTGLETSLTTSIR